MDTVRVAEGKERRQGAALRVLIADDDRDTVDTLAVVLESEGYVVQRVYGGVEALRTVPVFRPDAVILDISVPVISGFGIAQAIRHSFVDIRRPLLIAISGKWKEGPDRLIAQQVGFDHYLVKPCDTRALLELLARAGRSAVK